MKITCLKNHLKEAISLTEKISGKNLTLPILGNILISSEDKKLKLTATNLEIGIEVEIPAKIEKTGKLAVPAGIISGFVSTIGNEEKITLETVSGNNLLIATQNSSTLIKGQPTDDFPTLPKPENKKEAMVSSVEFLGGLKSVWYASSLSGIKPEIASVFVSSPAGQPLIFVATDSFRLAEKKTKQPAENINPVLIPQRSVSEIMRILDGREEKIKITTDKNQIFVVLENIKFVSRVVEGVFPDYQQIVPKKFTTDVVLDKNELVGGLRAASIFSNKQNEISISTDAEGEIITLQTINSETGEHTSNISAKITGEAIRMNFNYKYILDCLPHINSSGVLMRFSGNGKPMVITGVEDSSFQYLVMPMNAL